MATDTRDTATSATQVRSRRDLLAAALGGLGGLFAARLAAPVPAAAAAGGPLILGSGNSAGSASTTLTTTSTGTALFITQSGSGAAVRGSAVGPNSIAGFFTAYNGTGISGVTANAASYGVFGSNDAAGGGTGGAIRADGNASHGLVATTDSAAKVALKASNPAVDGTVALFENTSGGTGYSAGPALRAYTGGGSDALVHPGNRFYDGAGEFAGPSGVIGAAAGSSGYGVLGLSTDYYGVSGESTSGVGVSGVTSTGVAGVSGSATGGVGVRGHSHDGTGVHGSSTWGSGVLGTSSHAVGVYGYTAEESASAGYFEGLLTATTKNFRIDHPQDPANKILVHSCVESDERLTVYAGRVTTDSAGEATVALPGYFEALNRDVRYQLTVIGSFAQAMVKREIAGNRFTLATSEPNTKVSWQVTGVRQDAYAKAHPLVVESVKTRKEKGKFLNPVEHGQPESKGVHYEMREAGHRAAP